MPTIDKQIEFISNIVHVEENENLEMYNEILKTLESCKRNTLPLHLDRKKCLACGQYFTIKNDLQECCDSKCRVRLHRSKKRFENFNQKVEEVLRMKNPKAKFIIEQKISDSKSCPFVVIYEGKRFESNSTRNLLTQLRKI